MAVVQYTFTHKQYIEQHNRHKEYIQQYNLERVRTVPGICVVYPGICLTTEEKAGKTLSLGSRTMPVGKEYTEQRIILKDFYFMSDDMI